MAYATQADVDSLIARYVPTTTTTPNLTQSALIIDGVSDEIDSAIAGAGYTVPVTTPAYFLDYLSYVNALGAAAAILRSMFSDSTEGAAIGAYQFWYDWYKSALERLAGGEGIPPEVTTNAAYVAPSTYLTNNPDTEVDLGDIAEPLFKIGQVF